VNDDYVSCQLLAVASGRSNVSDVLRSAKALTKSGRCDDGIKFLAGMHHEENFHKRLRKTLGGILPEMYPVPLTLKVGPNKTEASTHYAMCTFDVLHLLHKTPEQFQKVMLGTCRGSFKTFYVAPTRPTPPLKNLIHKRGKARMYNIENKRHLPAMDAKHVWRW